MPHTTQDFTPIAEIEVLTKGVSFANALAVGETLASVTSLVVTVASGVDSAPSSRIVAGPAIVGANVTFQFGNSPVPGVKYIVTATVLTSLGNQLSGWAYLPAIAA